MLHLSDPNHKPEMTIAITPFLALCGFRPLSAIAAALNNTPELASLIPSLVLGRFVSLATSNGYSENQKAALKDLFSALMTTDKPRCKEQVTKLVDRYKRGQVKNGEEKDIVDLVLRLDSQFPGDIGIWCAFMLNYVTLQPGEAMFLGAGEPHAYIAGGMYKCCPLLFDLNGKNNLINFSLFRVHGMHGQLGQCHSRRVDPEITRRTQPCLRTDLLRI